MQELQDIDISNFEEDRNPVLADLPLKGHISFSFFIPFFLVIIISLISIFFIPNRFSFFTEYKPLFSSKSNKNNYQQHIKFDISKISPSSQSILLTFFIKKNSSNVISNRIIVPDSSQNHGPDPSLSSNMEYNLSLTRDEMLVKTITIGKIAIDKIATQTYLFFSEILDFDQIQLSMRIFGKSENKKENKDNNNNQILVIKTRVTNQIYGFFVNVIRIVCSVSLFPPFFTNFLYLLSKSGSLERKLTILLVFFTILYIDPFFVLNTFSPSQLNLYLHIMFRDIYFSYLIFYCLSIYSYFGRHRGESKLAAVSLGILFFVISFVLLITKDISLDTNYKTAINSLSNSRYTVIDDFDSLYNVHYILLALFIIAVPLRVVSAYADIERNSMNRYAQYTLMTMVPMTLLAVFEFFDYFTSILSETAFRTAFPITLFTAFAFLMERAHREDEDEDGAPVTYDNESKGNGYLDAQYDIAFGDNFGANPMGVEEDIPIPK